MERTIYLDYQATTPADPRVVEAMLPYFTRAFGNPHSRQHAHGWAAEDAVEAARRQVAALIGAHARDIIFISGATESNNLAIKGMARPTPGATKSSRVPPSTNACWKPAAVWSVKVSGSPSCRSGERPYQSRPACRRAQRTHGAGLGDGGQQRDRRHPAHRRDRAPRAPTWRAVPHRRSASGRQDRARRRSDEYRSHEHLRPQALRTDGHRRALCAPAAGAAFAAAVRRWWAGAGASFRYAAAAAVCRARRGVRNRGRGDG